MTKQHKSNAAVSAADLDALHIRLHNTGAYKRGQDNAEPIRTFLVAYCGLSAARDQADAHAIAEYTREATAAVPAVLSHLGSALPVPLESPTIPLVPIAEVERGEDVHTREKLDDKTVGKFVDVLEAGDAVPPGVVFYDGERYWLSDGRHRIEAHIRKGYDSFPAEVRAGGRRAAVLHALTCDRNLVRNGADKKKAAKLLLLDPEWRQWSDREIARRSGASAPTVGKLRKELGLVDEARKGKDGKKRKVAKIGRKPKRNCKLFTVGTAPHTTDETEPADQESTSTEQAETADTASPRDSTTRSEATTTASADDGGTEVTDASSTTASTTEHADTEDDSTSRPTSPAACGSDDSSAGDAENESNAPSLKVAFKVVREAVRGRPRIAAEVIAQLAIDGEIDVWMPTDDPSTDIDDLRSHLRSRLHDLAEDDHEAASAVVDAITDDINAVLDETAPEGEESGDDW